MLSTVLSIPSTVVESLPKSILRLAISVVKSPEAEVVPNFSREAAPVTT
jgi:hypothetical protein